MRKIVTLSMVAAAAFAVSACGKTENTNVMEANSMVTEMNATDAMEGTTNDSMTNVDGAMGASDNMMADNMSSNMAMNSSDHMAGNKM
ncbi:MAG: hypothetical protein H0X36_11745 [Sphingomonadaceae bacterium]|nr:hypothetical protein [Sphingomonadaceae bacterium]